jgi:hypothetical protein
MEAEIAILKKLNEKGLSRDQAANEVGMSRVHYTNIVNGHVVAKEVTLRAMLYELGYEKNIVTELVREYFERH